MILLRKKAETWRLFAAMALMGFLISIVPVSQLVPSAWATPQEDLNQAIELYDFADYQASLDILDGILAGNLATGNVLRDTHIYRARSYIGLDNSALAQDAFCSALKTDNNWRPDGVFYSSVEISVFDQSLADCDLTVETKSDGVAWYKKPVYLIAGGVVLVGGVVMLLAGGGDEEVVDPTPESLDGFPDPPTSK